MAESGHDGSVAESGKSCAITLRRVSDTGTFPRIPRAAKSQVLLNAVLSVGVSAGAATKAAGDDSDRYGSIAMFWPATATGRSARGLSAIVRKKVGLN
jgi:hypothetical protein